MHIHIQDKYITYIHCLYCRPRKDTFNLIVFCVLVSMGSSIASLFCKYIYIVLCCIVCLALVRVVYKTMTMQWHSQTWAYHDDLCTTINFSGTTINNSARITLFYSKLNKKQIHCLSYNASISVCMQYVVNPSINTLPLMRYIRPLSATYGTM